MIVVREDTSDVLISIKKWAEDKLPNYSLPSKWKIVSAIPRNAMGKVNKKELVKELFSETNT